jgi:hypothetical protein
MDGDVPMTAPILPDFSAWLEEGAAALDAADTEGWHGVEFDKDGVPYVHASSVSGCPRKFVLQASGAISEGNPVASVMNFALGNTIHTLFENTLKVLPQREGWSVLTVEQGLTHSKMALKGRADAILISPSSEYVLCDWKSEAATSKTMREKQYADRVRPEHKLQCTAGALLAEDAELVSDRIETGMICYVSRQLGKNVWDFESIPFEITEALRAEVVDCVTNRVEAWNKYRDTNELPPALAKVFQYGKLAVPWMCNPRSAIDRRGKFCEFRTACAAHMGGVEL